MYSKVSQTFAFRKGDKELKPFDIKRLGENCFRHFDFAQMEDMSRLLADVTVLTLSFFYPALVCVILLPVYFLLKKHIRSLS